MVKKTQSDEGASYTPGPEARMARRSARYGSNAAGSTRMAPSKEPARKAAFRAEERRDDPMIAAGKQTLKEQQERIGVAGRVEMDKETPKK